MTEADLDPLGKLAVREVRPAYIRRLGDPKPWLETFRLGAELAGAGVLGWAILHSIGLM